MLKIVYPTCCRIYVHKTFIIAIIAITNDKNVISYTADVSQLLLRACFPLRNGLNIIHALMFTWNFTVKYRIPVFNILESDMNICLAHPKHIKAMRTDKKDAKWIVGLFKHNLVASSFILSLKIRQLRNLFRYRMKLTQLKSSEKK